MVNYRGGAAYSELGRIVRPGAHGALEECSVIENSLQNLDRRPSKGLLCLGRRNVLRRLPRKDLKSDWGCSEARSEAHIEVRNEVHRSVSYRTVESAAGTPIEAVLLAVETLAHSVHIDFRARSAGRQDGSVVYRPVDCPGHQ